MRKIALKNIVWKEGKHYIGWNLNTNVSSFGNTRRDALRSLKEALELYLEDTSIVKVSRKEIPHGTFQSILLHSGLKESDFRDK